LTLQNPVGKSNGKVFSGADSFYSQWRQQGGVIAAMCDRGDSPPEQLLQAIWQHQRLLRHQLVTLDGVRVRVLHPGFWNREGGPDFGGAVVQFGDEPPQTGDIEVDLQLNGWRAHGHNRNAAFKRVILQVVWNAETHTAPARARTIEGLPPPPALPIRDRLDAPIGELRVWLTSELASDFPETLRGQCCAPMRTLSPEQVTVLLAQAAEIRFHAKAGQLHSRARQAGREQALWEGIFRGLGYKHNIWPMQCLAEQRARWGDGTDPLALQARLLGIGGLLPSDVPRAHGSSGYLRTVWDLWWRERHGFSDCLLPKSLWRFHGHRPANHPQRRLALAAHWLAAGDLPSRIEHWCASEVSDSKLASSLLEALRVVSDEFWAWHWTIRSPRLPAAHPLLGHARITDLAVNVILPWLWTRASEGGNLKLQREIERRYNVWPAAQDNAVLRLARQRLLGGGVWRALHTAAEQQGLMQIVRDFCDHSNAVCENCRFPELVKGMPHGTPMDYSCPIPSRMLRAT
jgi:hypothetical protein